MEPLGIEPATPAPRPAGPQAAPSWLYPPTSRYADVPITTDEGRRCLTRRLVPPATENAPLYRVTSADRIDLLAATHIGSALLWWRIADANLCDDPAALTAQPGRMLRLGVDAIGGPGTAGLETWTEGTP